jgi:2-keto-4-pentenoate hydratase/2-oxohepta-3-ene-1,7-dioic acid hydratase in catechol pathway
VLVVDRRAIDIHRASEQRFGPAMADILDDWRDFLRWYELRQPMPEADYDVGRLGPPVPQPRQIFAVGLNYVGHARETGWEPPSAPMIFTKFASAVCGPDETVELPPGNVDWEVELVVVIGIGGHRIDAADALRHVAGVMVGQDLSERVAQMQGTPPQFSLAKSHPRFAPTGPTLVSLDEIPPIDALNIECTVNGQTVQRGSTGDMVFGVRELIAAISDTVTLLSGDLIFTGTPDGVGMGRTPPVYLGDGDIVVSTIEGIGQITQRCTARVQR